MNQVPTQALLDEGTKMIRVAHLQHSVSILLRFASESVGLEVGSDLIAKVTPLLALTPDQVDSAGETALWECCNALTQLIKPTSLENARLAVELSDFNDTPKSSRGRLTSANAVRRRHMFWVGGTSILLFFYIVVQGYAVGLVTALDDAKKHQTQIGAIQTQMATLGAGSGTPIISNLEQQRLESFARLEAARRTMERLVRWTPIAPVNKKDNIAADKASKANTDNSRLKSAMMSGAQVFMPAIDTLAIEVYARIWRDVVLGYLIPLLLGLIGASAYVIRQISVEIKTSTYATANTIRDKIRIVQGATFGTLAGILAAAIDTNSAAAGVSIPIIALVCGYNAELVFRAMDAAGIKFKNYLSAGA